MDQAVIPITFDKSHLTTIGTRMYAESLDLVRELVANAYDADAKKVWISVSENEVVVEDDGVGMDREGLVQYFTIGSNFKKDNPVSPELGRRRIGEFGIGKFAVLSLADEFMISTKRDGYAATVFFDKGAFENSDRWEVPVVEIPGGGGKNGTKVTMARLKRLIPVEQLERRLRQQLPLAAKDFAVFINGNQMTAQFVPGRRYRIRDITEYGAIAGEIILSSLILPAEQVGVAVRVRGMMIRRETFGVEGQHAMALRRLTGEINADFLPLTSARDNFLQETPEYRKFLEIIHKKMRQVVRDIKKSAATRLDLKADQALSDALTAVKQALKKNSDIFLMHDLPLLGGASGKLEELERSLGTTTLAKSLGGKNLEKLNAEKLRKVAGEVTNRKHRSLVKTVLKDKNRVIKKMKVGGVDLVCSLARLGEGEMESFVEGGIIFINRDHKLFAETNKNDELAAYHLARLITKELVNLANPVNVSQAFEWQSRLLTDAIVTKSNERRGESNN